MGSLVLALCSLLRFSYFKSRLFLFCTGGSFLFFLAHWKAYTFGHLQFSKIDAIEGQYFVQFLYLMNILLGFDFFWFELPTPSFIDEFLLRRMEVADILVFVLITFGTVHIISQLFEICKINGRTTFAGLRTFSPMTWLISCFVLALLNYLLVSYFIYDYVPQFFSIIVLIPMAKLSWMIMMAYMAKCHVPALDPCLLPSFLLLIWFIMLRYGLFMDYITRPSEVFNALFCFSVLDIVYFIVSNICLISRELGYPIFTVRTYNLPM